MKTNRKTKVCSTCGKTLQVNEGIHHSVMGHEKLGYCLYLFDCECGSTLSEKRDKKEWKQEQGES